MNSVGDRIAAVLIGLAVAVVIVTLAIVPFLTPGLVAAEQGRSRAEAWTGFSTAELATATDSILHDLVLGGDFAVEVNGQPVLNERERAHMSDVRTVFRGLWILAAISVVGLIVATRRPDRSGTWRAVRRGALGLTVGVVALGAIALFAFDQLFEVFHEVFFPAGSFTFDPRTDRLVQLFPFRFWDETTMAVGAVIIGIALIVAVAAGRSARRSAARRPAAELAAVPEPGS